MDRLPHSLPQFKNLKIFIFLLMSFFIHAEEFELFCDWAHAAKGQELFPLNEKTPSLMGLLRKKLIEQNSEIRCWELEKYRPLLLRKEPIQPNARWIFCNLGPHLLECDFSKVPKEKLILIMLEPPTVQEGLYALKLHEYFGQVFTWDDDLVDNEKYFKIHYPALRPRIEPIVPFEKKKFCTLICRRITSKHPKELYSERKKVIKFFEKKPAGEFDFYGFDWKPKKYKNYKGSLENKLEKLKEYKFSICYENMRDVKGYISEKIFDCFVAGVVPVYWGASNVADYVPEGCFIDRRRFANNGEMYQFLKAITKEEYQRYLDNAAAFLNSPQAKIFTNEYFVDHFLADIK